MTSRPLPGAPTEQSLSAELAYWERNELRLWRRDLERYRGFFPFAQLDWAREQIADVGSGPFSVLEVFAPPEARVVAVDALADEYNARFPDKRYPIVQALPDQRFSLILLLNALDHMEAPDELLAVLEAHLAPGGQLWLHVHIERPYPTDEHPQRFTFAQLNRLLSHRFDLVRVRLRGDGGPWPIAWSAILAPRQHSATARAATVVWADITCTVARGWLWGHRMLRDGYSALRRLTRRSGR